LGREIERKFRVIGESWRADVSHSVSMRQGYLSQGGNASVRVRIEGDRANINIKSATLSIERAEYEYPVPTDEARELLALCVDLPIEKTRHHVSVGPFTFEIDEFEGANAGLIVAELELESPEQVFPQPAWLGEDVSLDKRYYNVYLAQHPFETWSGSRQHR
jgi:adenylate cyclase